MYSGHQGVCSLLMAFSSLCFSSSCIQ
uniref:Uncharacterized protein n=1 Tax=Anguilla anguilla TaxID=7936 RepID=A0A0E9THK3_ANGAN